MIIDPITRQRVPRMPHTGDITYDLDINAGSSIAMEDVPLIGPWSDYTGSDLTVNSKQQQQFAGMSNELFGQDAAIEGTKVPNLNIVGKRKETHRRRLIKRYNDGR